MAEFHEKDDDDSDDENPSPEPTPEMQLEHSEALDGPPCIHMVIDRAAELADLSLESLVTLAERHGLFGKFTRGELVRGILLIVFEGEEA